MTTWFPSPKGFLNLKIDIAGLSPARWVQKIYDFQDGYGWLCRKSIRHLNRDHFKRKWSSSNQHFSGDIRSFSWEYLSIWTYVIWGRISLSFGILRILGLILAPSKREAIGCWKGGFGETFGVIHIQSQEGFPKKGVKSPKWMFFLLEHLIVLKMDDLGGTTIFGNILYICLYMFIYKYNWNKYICNPMKGIHTGSMLFNDYSAIFSIWFGEFF